MADGLYRLTGKPGVIIGNEGPGVANLAAAAIAAAKENTPTIFIAGQRERYFDQQVRRGHFQYTRQPRYFEEAMKFVGVIDHADHVDDIFHEAFRQAFTGKPGPVYIEYPQDYAGATHTFGPLKQPAEYRLVNQSADAASLEAAVTMIEQAEQPVLLVGDLRDVVPQLQSVLEGRVLQPRFPDNYSQLLQSSLKDMNDAVEAASSETAVHPAHLATEISRAMPDNPVIIRDGGAVCLWNMAFNTTASSDMHWCQNFGHLGTGIPHAIGAQLAVGDSRRVVLISGDSAFQFHISELETAVRKNLPIVFVVGCDYAWGLEVKVYNVAFGDDAPNTEAQWGKQVRFDKIAEGYGAHGEYVERREDIAPAIERALASGRPAVVQVPIDPRINAVEVPAFEEFATWYGDKGYS